MPRSITIDLWLRKHGSVGVDTRISREMLLGTDSVPHDRGDAAKWASDLTDHLVEKAGEWIQRENNRRDATPHPSHGKPPVW